MLSEWCIEKHRVPAHKDLWAAAELANSVPRERERATFKLRGGDPEDGDKATQAAWMKESGEWVVQAFGEEDATVRTEA